MAGHRLVLGAGQDRFDPVGGGHRPLVAARHLGTAGGHPRRVCLDDAEAREFDREPFVAAVQRAQRRRRFGQPPRLAQLLGPHRLAGDELGDEAGRVVQHRHHNRPDPRSRRQLAGGLLRRAVDLQQLGVLAGQAHDHVGAGETDPVVAVGDAAGEGDRLAFKFAQTR